MLPHLLSLLACSTAPAPPPTEAPPERSRPNIILISLDTTRADAIGAWQDTNTWGLDIPEELRPVPQTPALDYIAQHGVRFRWAFSHAPTTLSSHTSAFSGRDPHHHRVVRNGYPVPSDIPLMQETFAEAGWGTRAVVASAVLAPDQGLSRGFESWIWPQSDGEDDTPVIRRENAPPLAVAWRANTVTSRALTTVDEHLAAGDGRPLMLFAHYYDPHTDWSDAPDQIRDAMTDPDYDGPVDGSMATIGALVEQVRNGTASIADRRQARGLYLAEVVGADQQVGRLMRGLAERSLLDNAYVIVFSDHGEHLDDSIHTPYHHGAAVSQEVIHVPLLIAGFGEAQVPTGVVNLPVGLVDIAPTACKLVGLSCGGGQGQDLARLWTDPAAQPLPIRFSEATKPIGSESKEKWNNLPFERSAWGVVNQRRLLLLLSPYQQENQQLRLIENGAPAAPLDAESQAAASTLLEAISRWDADAPPFRAEDMDEDTRAALIALGYLEE
jgi:arylsulfatase A-like enzyme